MTSNALVPFVGNSGVIGVVFTSVKHAITYAAQHSGVPVSVVTAIALVISWRIFKRSLGFIIEVAVALGCVLVATKLGWISW